MALTQISTQGIKDGTITGTDLATNVDLVDNQKIRFGTGNDLQIYHDGSSSYVDHVGIGNLFIRGNDTNAISLKAVQSKNSLICHANAQVQLYHNNSLKFETTSAGTSVSGNLVVGTVTLDGGGLSLSDNDKLKCGNGDDLQIYHDPASGGSGFIDVTGALQIHTSQLYINNEANTERLLRCTQNDSVELYFDGSLKLSTINGGISVTGGVNTTGASSFNGDIFFGDNKKTIFGAGSDLQIYHDGSNSYIQDAGTGVLIVKTNALAVKNAAGDENLLYAQENVGVELFYDNSKKFETQNLGVTVTGGVYPAATDTYQLGGSSLRWNELNIKSVIDVSDNGKIRMGDSDDLQIYHDGSDSFINDAGTGSLIIKSSQIIIREADDGAMAYFKNEGAVELNFNNSKKFETTSSGVDITHVAQIGTSNDQGELRIGHDGSSYRARIVSNSSNSLEIDADGPERIQMHGGVIYMRPLNSEKSAAFVANGAVELYHNNVKQMETTSGGASIRNHHKFDTGTVTQRSYLSSGNGINHRIMLAGAGTSNVQGQYIRAFANCANIDDSGTVKFVIFATGDCQNANNSFAGFSDVNLKQDITDASSQWDDIKNLKVRKYRFKNNPTGPLQIGCIAQEAETVSPGLIDTDPEEGFKSLKYSVLYMKGIKCLQEAMARIEALETEVAALKTA